MLREQRAHARKLMHEQAFLLDSSGTSWAPIVLLDISLGGISFAIPEAIISGTVRQLLFTVPGSPTRHQAQVCIVHRSTSGVPTGFRIGARFIKVDPDTTEQILNFVSKSV
jgi:c-di-GMP-binding flagellar brake protein YcgR